MFGCRYGPLALLEQLKVRVVQISLLVRASDCSGDCKVFERINTRLVNGQSAAWRRGFGVGGQFQLLQGFGLTLRGSEFGIDLVS